MKTDKLLHLIQQKKAMRSGGALPLPKHQDVGPVAPINLNEVTITGEPPSRIEVQRNIVQQTNPKKNYGVIDKQANRIYYYKPSGDLIKSESIITGKSNNDVDRGLSMKEWFEQTGSDSHEDYFKYLEENKYQTTPSGIFKISGKRSNTAQDPSLLGRIINTFRPERAAQIRESRLRDYGLQQKLFTLKDEENKGSSKAIHGTNNPVRIDAFNDPTADRNLSNGCINVNGETICFDTLGRGSKVYIMPEEQTGYLYPKELRNNLAGMLDRKQPGGQKTLPKQNPYLPPKQNPYLPNTPLATGAIEITYSPIDAALALISGAGLGPVAFKLSTDLTKSSAANAQLLNEARQAYKNIISKQPGGLAKAQYGWMTPPGLSFPKSSQAKPTAAAQIEEVEYTPIEQMDIIYNKGLDDFTKEYEKANVFPELSGRTVNLSKGRYQGAKVPIEYLQMLYNSSVKAGIDPMQSLAQGARETLFLQDSNIRKRIKSGMLVPNQEALISGWNVDEKYEPYDPIRFLADKKIPGIKAYKGFHGMQFVVEDEKKVNEYLKKNPKVMEQYTAKVQSRPHIDPKSNYFDLYHDWVKQKGVRAYNPGDTDYSKKVDKDIQLLKSDPEFMKFYATGFKQAGGEELQYVPNGTYGNYYDPATQQYIPQVYLPDVNIVADRELPFQDGKFAPFLAARGTAEYVPVESMLLPGTPVVKGLGKVGNVLLDAANPLVGMNVGKGLKNLKQEILYRGITPVGYGAKEKAKMFLPNLLKYRSPEDKVIDIATEFERGMNTSPKLIREIKKKIQKQYKLSPEEYKSLSAEEKFDLFPQSHFNDLINQSKKRVDAWRTGLGLDQVYDTFDVADGKYRIKDSGIEPGRFSTLWNDIRASELKDKVYMGDDPLVSLAKKHQEITSPKIETPYGSYSVRDLMRYLSKEKEQLKPWEQTRIVEPARNKEFQWSVYDADPKGVMGQMRWDVSETPEGMLHWQANDTWDLHPWSRRGSINVNEDKLAELTRDLHRRKFLENVEVLDLLGGKPFDIQNNYIVDPKTMQIVKQWKSGGLTKGTKNKVKVNKPR